MKQLFYLFISLIISYSAFAIDTPILLSPIDSATDQPTNPSLDWEDVTDASLYEYQYSTDVSFTSFWNDFVSSSNASLTGLNNDYTYYWRVRASDGTDYSSWSTIWSFTTLESGSGLANPILISPVNNATNVVTSPSLLWNIVANANEYEYQYSTDPGFSSFYSDTTQSASISIGPLESNTTYYWRIQATDGTIYSDWSSIWSFTTENNMSLIDHDSKSLLLYPNPANSFLKVQTDKRLDTISIFDSFGKKVYTYHYLTKKENLIDIQFLSNGIYTFRFNLQNTIINKKIWVLHP
jgi:hypothetical protein